IGHGCVYSIGTVILQACKRRYLMPNCSFMIHYGSLSLDCSYKIADDTLDYYRKQADAMVNIYYQKCKFGQHFLEWPEKEIKSFLKTNLAKDWYMSSYDAVYYGFADEVLTERKYRNVRQINKRNRRVAE
ncbi:MAG: ATP-dependent Clp protease proteolytic subunit, partial [Planktothrix sp.]